MDKTVKRYAKLYGGAIKRKGLADVKEKMQAYAVRLEKMYASEQFKAHDVYPSIDTKKVYAVICMCLMLKEYGLSKDEIIDTVNDSFRKLKKVFWCIEKVIDLFPSAWNVAKKWNINDHRNRVADGSITYDYFNVADDSVSYSISHCKYVDMFDDFGIKEYCKIFCMSDTQAYANLTRHVNFVRHSDLTDGYCCRDEISKK